MVTGGLSSRDGVDFYRIDGVEEMQPFLMTVVSDSDLWMFVSSTGALTAGRIDADHSLFPYETDDRLHRAAGTAGPVTVIARTIDGVRQIWRPFGRELSTACTRSIAKSVLGDRLVFEEHHHQWSLVFRMTWVPSDAHGWVRTVELVDEGGQVAGYEVLDGLLDVMPSGVDAHTQQTRSNLVNAYKRSETGPWGSLAVYSLEALISDRAEPAEALNATVVWSAGFDQAELDLDGHAVDAMLEGRQKSPSHLIKGRPGAYLLSGSIAVPAWGSVSWTMVADTGLDHVGVLDASRAATTRGTIDAVTADVELGSQRLAALLDGADAVQATADKVADAHHLSNVLFNSMRGGLFPYGHQVPIADVSDFVAARNRPVFERHRGWFDVHDPWIDVGDLRRAALSTDDPDLTRLVLEYLPLTFSRRHGDPSRPWNRFSINIRSEAGDQLLSYEGNWRDIFQNWEALLHSYPAYLVHVVAKFVNASTIEGYNPYRISRSGIDWEVPDPDDPWSHIGYWGDHQIIYLLRLLETWQQYQPGVLGEWLDRRIFVYADVPYHIADHDAIVHDPRNTISYDAQRAAAIVRREERLGADGRLLVDTDGSLLRVSLLEKLLVPALGKLTNFVPEGGIWLNTQRPEWNDANNALAGPGLSMVTLYHLRRYLEVVRILIAETGTDTATLSTSVAEWLSQVLDILELSPSTSESTDDRQRRTMVDALGRSGAAHRGRVAAGSGSVFDSVDVPTADLELLCVVACRHLDGSIRSGRRDDGLYHSYNRVSFPADDSAQVDHLGPMLEGQVAVLSSGALDTGAALAVVDSLFASGMYRVDQSSFMLYPATELHPFLDRNVVPDAAAQRVEALGRLDGDLGRIFTRDDDGRLHFRSELANSKALEERLDHTELSIADSTVVLEVYEQVFAHRSFTGRSGSMYGYEGIGSIYWHMVAKLVLAVQETYWAAVDRHEPDELVVRLVDAYRRLRSGLGFMKTPASYGAIPTDCYSHTPAHAGAQQPGMTGQVKEEVLTRLGELGFRVINGRAVLAPGLIAPNEVFPIGRGGEPEPARFTVCSVPVTIDQGGGDSVTIIRSDGTRTVNDGLELTPTQSRELFARAGTIARIVWTIGDGSMLRWTRMHHRSRPASE